jgi:hypothetical protein
MRGHPVPAAAERGDHRDEKGESNTSHQWTTVSFT